MTHTKMKGASLPTFALLLVVGGFLVMFALKIIPMYMEFGNVKSAMEGLKEGEYSSANEVRESLRKRLDVNYVSNVGKDDVSISSSDRGYHVEVDYYVEKPLFGPISLTGNFTHAVDVE